MTSHSPPSSRDHFDQVRALLAAGAEREIETHISVVFLEPERVLKLKKPVALGFLDFRR